MSGDTKSFPSRCPGCGVQFGYVHRHNCAWAASQKREDDTFWEAQARDQQSFREALAVLAKRPISDIDGDDLRDAVLILAEKFKEESDAVADLTTNPDRWRAQQRYRAIVGLMSTLMDIDAKAEETKRAVEKRQ